MKTDIYTKIIIAVLAICVLLTAAHVIYAVWAYQHCSIIYFIGGELW